MTIAQAYRIIKKDQLDKEALIDAIYSRTGATRKAILKKLNQLRQEAEEKDSEIYEESSEIMEDLIEEITNQEDSETDETEIDEIQSPSCFYPKLPFNLEPDGGIEEDETEISVKLALMKENQQLKASLKKLRLERGTANLLLEDIAKTVSAIKPLPMIYCGNKDTTKKSATLVSLLADFHIGSEEYIPGFNRFNYDVACKRINLYLRKVLDWCELHRNSYIVDEICLVCLGDLISGDIHDELRRTNEFSCPEQVKKASELLSVIVSSVAPHFKKVRVEFVVPDNHSRVTEKIQFADGTNSYNYLVGHLTKALTRDIPNVEFNVYPEIQQVIRIQGRRYLIMHGNCVRGGGGQLFPMTGISRKLWRESHLRMNMSEDMHFDKILMGHYHSPIDTPDISVAGCLVSSTGFDASAARHTPACITSFFVSGKHEFDYTPFWLNEGETY